MQPSAETSISNCQWQDLPLTKVPDAQQLATMQAYLDLALLSLESLVGLSSQTILQAARELNLGSVIPDSEALERLRQPSSRLHSEEGQSLDVEETRSLVLLVCHLAGQHQELIRRAVTLLEQLAVQGKSPQQTALLSRYLDNFSRGCQSRWRGELPAEWLSQVAWQLPIDLLFYSTSSGQRRLWLSLLEAAV
jgi:hypothetical protein